MFQYFQNTLCVEVNFLLNEIGIPLYTYQSYCKRGALNVIRRGGNGRTALVEFETMRDDLKKKIEQIKNPKESASVSILESYLEKDYNAANFFIGFRKLNGKPLSAEKQLEYTTNAIILNAIDTIVIAKKTNMKRLAGNKTRLWENISNAVNLLPSSKYPHSLPGNMRTLERVYKRYKKDGYDSLVHKGMDNDNRTKIVGEVADWILATYCLPTKIVVPVLLNMYDEQRKSNGWPSLSESAIQLFLDRPEVKRVWFLARHGKDEFKKAYGHKLSRNRSEWFPNAYWAVDGSKLDWIHYEEDAQLKMAARLKMNPVFDVYSEVILGSSYSTTENHTDHFKALKEAVNFSGKRPYKLTYDNQSGHKTKRMQELYDRIVAKPGGVHNPTRAEEKSNPVEQIFNRFQQQILGQFFFSDKQSIKARNLNNLPNMDFIKEHQHKLMTKEELLKVWHIAVDQWNNALHPDKSGRTRMEVYQSHETHAQEFDMLDMITTFWVDETKAIQYRAEGLRMKLGKKEYWFEVLDENEKIDKEFRKYNIGKKFIVRYDPETMDQYIQLFEVDAEGNKVFAAYAQPKRQHQEIPILMKEGDKEAYLEDFSVRDEELEDVAKEIEALRQRTGITPEQLIDDQEFLIKMGGSIPKEIRNENEANGVFNLL